MSQTHADCQPTVRRRSGTTQRRTDRDPTARPKSVLICPDCGHESHVDGDWVRDESDRRRRYACPNCGTVVVSQPRFVHANAV